jgi:hypothetical protein
VSTGVIFEQSFCLNKSIKIFINYLLGPAFLLWLSWDVYHQITAQQSLSLQWQTFVKITASKGYVSLIFVLWLMLLQWMLEAVKWKILLKDIVNVSLTKAFRTILSGITVSVVTPNRLGEFAGRVVHLPNGTRVEGTVFTFMGNLAQLIVTCLVGGIALFIGYDQLKLQLGSEESIYTVDLLLILSPFAVLILILVYFSSSWVLKKLGHWKLLNAFSVHLLVLSRTSNRRLAYVLFLSFIRYGIFILQYLIVFRFTGLNNSFLDLTMGVSVMFLWLSIVPTFSFMEMGVRWQFALLLFPVIGAIPLAIPIAVTIIWLVNFIIPAFLGVVSLLHVSEKNDTDANIA